MSYNRYIGDDSVEIINPTTGKTDKDEISRLCKQVMFKNFIFLYGKVSALSSQGVVDTPRSVLHHLNQLCFM